MERLALALQRGDFLFELRLVQQIRVAGEYRHVLREIHARLLVHRPLVDGSCAQRAAFQLTDERLLAMQQIELVRVQRLLHRIDNDIHLVVRIELGNLIAFPYCPSVTLGEVGRTPRRVEVMDRHRPPLGVHARAEHTRRAEQHTHVPLVHRLYHRLPCLLVLALLYEADFACGDAVVLHQFALDFGVHIPATTGLVRAQIRKDKLRAFWRVVLAVILRYHLGTMARLVVGVVFVIRVNHAHIKRHFPGVVRGDEHLRLLLRLREPSAPQ